MTRALILGGTGDANRLAEAFSRANIDAVYSYAGSTRIPLPHVLPTRIGGFGGTDGLAAFLRQERITHVVDATHPFAVEISRHAVEACAATRVALVALERVPWTRTDRDRWHEVVDIDGAAAALPEAPARVFLAIGRKHLAPFTIKPQHSYTLRFVYAPHAALPLPNAEVVISRGPFTLDGDRDLMRARGIEWVVARNAGGDGARAK
ncbi:MAG: cobalt-precorrin-6A reductase, partial [Bradyrhizobium sp.]